MNKKEGDKSAGVLFFVLLIVGITGFSFRAKAEANVVINELAWMGTAESASNEWIELKNNTGTAVDLSDWKLISRDGSIGINLSGTIGAGGYFLLERTDDESVPSKTADFIYSGSLGNSGEYLELKNGAGDTIDFVDALDAWPAGDNASKQTMERGVDGSWQNSTALGGTPREQNSSASIDTNEQDTDDTDDASAGSGSGSASKKNWRGIVLINEVMCNPGEDEAEWVELYNRGQESVNLNSWSIVEGSGRQTLLVGSIGISKEKRFFVVGEIKGNLNNPGDLIILKDDKGEEIDRLVYGDWDKDLAEIIPAPGKGYSIARKEDGKNTFDNFRDFALSPSPSKGEPNIINYSKQESNNKSASKAKRKKFGLIISEIYPNPPGIDKEGEFIELFNAGEEILNLHAYKLIDAGGNIFKIKDKISIVAGEYLIFERSESNLALNNAKEEISLYRPGRKSALQKIKYKQAHEAYSYNCQIDAGALDCVWSKTATPGKKNIINLPNRSPSADFDIIGQTVAGQRLLFDSSDTSDPDGDELAYFWDFGDGFSNNLAIPDHIYKEAGKYTISLRVKDAEAEDIVEKIIEIMIGDSREDKINEAKEIDWGNIKISEILPNPAGDDATKEWIRLYNQGDTKVNLYNWSIDDAPGGSKPYTFGDAVWLEAGQHFTLSREDSRLALNNSGDEIRLYNPKQKLVDKLDYTKTREGISLKRIADGSLALDKEPEGTRIVAKQRVRKKASQPRRKKIIKKIVLSELNSIAVGTKIKTEGVVAVEPGILSSQYFYISGDGGIQVYSYHKSFPALQVGDYISVRGELSKVGSEQRIKISQASDITLIRKDSPPLAIKCSCADMSDKVPGSLVELDGEIVAKKGLKLFIDDGSAEAVVYIKESTGINDSVLLAGRKVSITGILNKTSGELRLMPRFSADIVLAGEDLSGDEAGRVLGESSETSEWDLEQRDKKNRLFPYAVLGLVFVVSLLGALLIKKYLL